MKQTTMDQLRKKLKALLLTVGACMLCACAGPGIQPDEKSIRYRCLPDFLDTATHQSTSTFEQIASSKSIAGNLRTHASGHHRALNSV